MRHLGAREASPGPAGDRARPLPPASPGGGPPPGVRGAPRPRKLSRTDYATNSNDSHWSNNPRQLFEGFDRIIGDERTPRSFRTREGLRKLEGRVAGRAGDGAR